jgi:hypothetical protein
MTSWLFSFLTSTEQLPETQGAIVVPRAVRHNDVTIIQLFDERWAGGELNGQCGGLKKRFSYQESASLWFDKLFSVFLQKRVIVNREVLSKHFSYNFF